VTFLWQQERKNNGRVNFCSLLFTRLFSTTLSAMDCNDAIMEGENADFSQTPHGLSVSGGPPPSGVDHYPPLQQRKSARPSQPSKRRETGSNRHTIVEAPVTNAAMVNALATPADNDVLYVGVAVSQSASQVQLTSGPSQDQRSMIPETQANPAGNQEPQQPPHLSPHSFQVPAQQTPTATAQPPYYAGPSPLSVNSRVQQAQVQPPPPQFTTNLGVPHVLPQDMQSWANYAQSIAPRNPVTGNYMGSDQQYYWAGRPTQEEHHSYMQRYGFGVGGQQLSPLSAQDIANRNHFGTVHQQISAIARIPSLEEAQPHRSNQRPLTSTVPAFFNAPPADVGRALRAEGNQRAARVAWHAAAEEAFDLFPGNLEQPRFKRRDKDQANHDSVTLLGVDLDTLTSMGLLSQDAFDRICQTPSCELIPIEIDCHLQAQFAGQAIIGLKYEIENHKRKRDEYAEQNRLYQQATYGFTSVAEQQKNELQQKDKRIRMLEEMVARTAMPDPPTSLPINRPPSRGHGQAPPPFHGVRMGPQGHHDLAAGNLSPYLNPPSRPFTSHVASTASRSTPRESFSVADFNADHTRSNDGFSMPEDPFHSKSAPSKGKPAPVPANRVVSHPSTARPSPARSIVGPVEGFDDTDEPQLGEALAELRTLEVSLAARCSAEPRIAREAALFEICAKYFEKLFHAGDGFTDALALLYQSEPRLTSAGLPVHDPALVDNLLQAISAMRSQLSVIFRESADALIFNQQTRELALTTGSFQQVEKIETFRRLSSGINPGNYLSDQRNSFARLNHRLSGTTTTRREDDKKKTPGDKRIKQAYCDGCKNSNVYHTRADCKGIAAGSHPSAPPSNGSQPAPAKGDQKPE
jgi:hypothetical protein